MKTNVRAYTSKELLDRVRHLHNFTHFPKEDWFLFVRSKEDQSNVFDDKMYHFREEKFQRVFSCTTNSGSYGLLNFFKWNKKGTFILKSDRWFYDGWKRGKHKGRMNAWVQNRMVRGYRDNDKDLKSEEGENYTVGFFGINIHTVTYGVKRFIKKYIGGWSVGCLVLNDTGEYFDLWDKTKKTDPITICLIKEF